MSDREKVRQVITEAITDAISPDPHVIADSILAALPAKMLRPMLAACLPGYVRTILATGRSLAPPSEHTPPQGPSATQAAPGRGGKSWRDAASLAWQRYLSQPVYVGNRKWKHLADCTRQDVAAAIMAREEQAAATLTAAKQLGALLTLMDEHGATVAGDLPAALGASVMAGAA